jgi:hypothetical protein
MEALSGRASKVLTTDSISESDLLALLAAADGKGLAVMAASRGRKDFNEGELDAMGSSGVDCNQAYVVVGVTQTARTVDLHNPRASGQVAPNMEIAEFQRWFGKVRISPAS